MAASKNKMKKLMLLLVMVSIVCCILIAKIFNRTPTKNGFKEKLLTKLKTIRTSSIEKSSGLVPCGEVCTYGGKIIFSDQKIKRLQKHIHCQNIMKRMAYRGHNITYPPLKKPPKNLYGDFTQFGACPLSKFFYKIDFRPGAVVNSRHFKADIILNMIMHPRNTNYGDGGCVLKVTEDYKDIIQGKAGVVIGTTSPWLETMLIGQNASHVMTLEYGQLTLEHPQLDAMTPYTFAEQYLMGNATLFDFGATFSSLEHSGLGRYGDPLNPYGDLEAMAQAWCMIKPGGIFILGIPYSGHDSCNIQWNAHRIYGSNRTQHMIANWKLLEERKCKDVHRLFVLIKPTS